MKNNFASNKQTNAHSKIKRESKTWRRLTIKIVNELLNICGDNICNDD